MDENEKKMLNEQLNTIVANAAIYINTEVDKLEISEEQKVRAINFVIVKLGKAAEHANKQMGIRSVNL